MKVNKMYNYLFKCIIKYGGSLIISNFFVASLLRLHLGQCQPQIDSPFKYSCKQS